MFIPADIDEITPAALNRLFEVSESGLPTVSAVHATALDGGYGYLSRVFRLKPTWTGGSAAEAPKSLIAKLPLRARLEEMTPDAVRMYRREAMFHRLVAPHLKLRTAKTWVAEFDEEVSAATLIYEDLGWMESFEDDETISPERVGRALIDLASLHVKYWNSPQLDDFDWLAYPVKTGVDQVPSARFRVLWPRMVQSGAYELSSVQLKLGELLCEKMDDVYASLHAGPESLIHTDLHQENIFFDGINPAFIDWALAERANPAKDVAKLTASCLEPGSVSELRPDLIKRYVRELQALGIMENSDIEFSRYVNLATCGYLAGLTFLSENPDFDSLVTNPETRTDFTKSRVIAACDSEEILATIEQL